MLLPDDRSLLTDGFLVEKFGRKSDPWHANAAQGARILDQVYRIVAGQQPARFRSVADPEEQVG